MAIHKIKRDDWPEIFDSLEIDHIPIHLVKQARIHTNTSGTITIDAATYKQLTTDGPADDSSEIISILQNDGWSKVDLQLDVDTMRSKIDKLISDTFATLQQ